MPDKVGKAGPFEKVKNAFALIAQLANGPPIAPFSLKLLHHLAELEIGILEKDQAENRQRVLGSHQFGVGTQFVRRNPETLFDTIVVSLHCNPS